MAKLQAKKISDALKKAQRVGHVEESVTICGCTITLKNLTPEEYEAALRSITEEGGDDTDAEGLSYITSYKKEHLSRSVCELNGESLREFEFVEVDVQEPDPRSPSLMVTKAVNIERADFVKNYVLATWSREAIDTLWKKFTEVMDRSEKVAIEGITFVIPNETNEEKFRRLLAEVKELEEVIPFELATAALLEVNYLPKTSKGELERASSKLEELAKETNQSETTVAGSETDRWVPLTAEQPVVEVPVVPQTPKEEQIPLPSLGNFLRSRPVEEVAITTPPNGLPLKVEPTQAVLRKASQIQELEGSLPDLGGEPVATTRTAATVLASQQPKKDPKAAAALVDQPPVVGINPRYRPQQR